MALETVAAAIRRVKMVLERRPDLALHEDPPGKVRWNGDLRAEACHPNGTRISTDMSTELGGGGEQVTPGWMFRAGMAACETTSIAIQAAAEGVALKSLEVEVRSRTDARGILSMTDESGAFVFAGPCNMELHVRIAADGVSPERLREVVATGIRCSPMHNAVAAAIPLTMHVETV